MTAAQQITADNIAAIVTPIIRREIETVLAPFLEKLNAFPSRSEMDDFVRGIAEPHIEAKLRNERVTTDSRIDEAELASQQQVNATLAKYNQLAESFERHIRGSDDVRISLDRTNERLTQTITDIRELSTEVKHQVEAREEKFRSVETRFNGIQDTLNAFGVAHDANALSIASLHQTIFGAPGAEGEEDSLRGSVRQMVSEFHSFRVDITQQYQRDLTAQQSRHDQMITPLLQAQARAQARRERLSQVRTVFWDFITSRKGAAVVALMVAALGDSAANISRYIRHLLGFQ